MAYFLTTRMIRSFFELIADPISASSFVSYGIPGGMNQFWANALRRRMR